MAPSMSATTRAALALMMMGIAATCVNAAAVPLPEHMQLVFKSKAEAPTMNSGRQMLQKTNGTANRPGDVNCGQGLVYCEVGCIPAAAVCCNQGDGLYCPAFAPKCSPPGQSGCSGVGAAIKAHLGAITSSLLLALVVMMIM